MFLFINSASWKSKFSGWELFQPLLEFGPALAGYHPARVGNGWKWLEIAESINRSEFCIAGQFGRGWVMSKLLTGLH